MEMKEFILEILNNLERKKIKYICLRGHNAIKIKNRYSEVDILVKKRDLPTVKEIFKNLPSRQFKNNIDLTHPFLVRVVKDDFVVDFDFQVDGIGYCGSAILKEEYLFEHSKKEKGIWVLDNEGKFLMLFIHGFIFKKKLEYFKKYEKEFFYLFSRIDKKNILKQLTKMFNEKYAKIIIKLLESNDLENLFKLRGNLIICHLIKNPKEILKVIISKIMRFRNYFKLNELFYFINIFKWGPLISFIGPDGSGKTTLAKLSQDYLNKFGIKSIIIPAGVFSGIKNPFKKKKVDHIGSYSKKISSRENNLKLLIRTILQIPKQIKILYYRKRGYFVITDRYAYDLIYFYSAEGLIRKFVKSLFQKPSRCFYVKVEQQIILKRNRELNIEAIRSIMKRIEYNKKYFPLTELENNTLDKAKKDLYFYLIQMIKNV